MAKIEKNYNETLLKKHESSYQLVNLWFELKDKLDFGEIIIYHEFPLFPLPDNEDVLSVNILVVTKNFGIFIFECVNYSSRIFNDLDPFLENLTVLDNLIFTRLLKDSPLIRMNRRGILVDIKPIIFIGNCTDTSEFEGLTDYNIITSEAELLTVIENNEIVALKDDQFADLKATLEGSKGILKRNSRSIAKKTNDQLSKGAILTKIENQIFNFDLEQKRAALFTLDGPQRIRGLAGSGKTVILAMKAAIIHLQEPDATILYTYYTKSLKEYVKRLITRFYRQFAEKDPDWDRIQILHAWGGFKLEGVYFNACKDNGISPINLTDAKRSDSKMPFNYVCGELDMNNLKKVYDYSLLDEAQDFPANFYRICRQITRKNKVVWAYDDFQNILNVNIQNEKETFGKDENGVYHVDFDIRKDELQDIVLYKCYRNPREVLIAAFSFGLGIYNENKGISSIIQRLETNSHWESLGFEVKAGDSSDGAKMKIERPLVNSPHYKNQLLNRGDLIKIEGFDTIESECKAVVNYIASEIEDELNPEDISVVCLDSLNIKKYFSYIRSFLMAKDIDTFDLQKAPSSNTVFKYKNKVSLSTIFKAKGNESGSIFVVGTDSVFINNNDIVQRNKLFTAITRSLGWVTITGVGDSMTICTNEFQSLKNNNFELSFIQPSVDDVKTIRQDMNKFQNALNKIERYAEQVTEGLGLTKEEKEEMVKQLKDKIEKK